MKLYLMHYKEAGGPKEGFVEATSLEKAEEVGREWCGKTNNRRFVLVRDAVLVREEAPKKA